MTGRHWLALAVLGSGLTSLAAMTLFAKGKKEEAFALAFTAGALSTTFAAARMLSAEAAPSSANAGNAVVGGDSSSWAPV